MSQVRGLRPAIWMVAVTVQIMAASRAESSLREPPAFFLVTTGPRGWALEAAPTPGYLLRSGPYRWSRNPMYTGEATVWAGWALFYASPAVWAGLVTVSAAFATIVPWEERRLLEHFGEDYRAYLADVPRWVPALRGAPDPPISAGSGPTGIATTKQGSGERASPLIMTRRTDKRAVNSNPRRP